jgi:hypothetical protein
VQGIKVVSLFGFKRRFGEKTRNRVYARRLLFDKYLINRLGVGVSIGCSQTILFVMAFGDSGRLLQTYAVGLPFESSWLGC